MVAERLTQLSGLMEFAEIVPCSAVDGFQLKTVADLLVARLPEGPQLYPDGELTDEPETTLIAELIREAALEGVRDELPHSLAVLVEEMLPHEGRDDMLDVHAILYVERSSQKGIIIGKGGARLKESAPTPAGRSRRCSVPRFSSSCTSRWPRTGSATRASCASSASDRVRRTVRAPTGARHGPVQPCSVEPDRAADHGVVVGLGEPDVDPVTRARPELLGDRPERGGGVPALPSRDDHAGAAAAVEHQLEAAQPGGAFTRGTVSSSSG